MQLGQHAVLPLPRDKLGRLREPSLPEAIARGNGGGGKAILQQANRVTACPI